MRLKDIRLAIVIPVSNHWELTEACLLYIYRHTHLKPPQINVIVVDDGSTDGTSDNLHGMLKDGRLPESMTYITHEEQQGFARSCNHGIDYALTPALGLFGAGFTHIMLLNNDVEAWDPSWLRTLLKPFEQEERLIVGPDFIDYNSATFVDDEMVPYIGGWCMVFPVELIHEIGVLDETPVRQNGRGWAAEHRQHPRREPTQVPGEDPQHQAAAARGASAGLRGHQVGVLLPRQYVLR